MDKIDSFLELPDGWHYGEGHAPSKETAEWAELLNLKLVDVIYRGVYDESIIKGLYRAKILDNECEGFVLRLASQFHYGQFRRSVAKFVRKNHVMTSSHWRFEKIVSNQLKRG